MRSALPDRFAFATAADVQRWRALFLPLLITALLLLPLLVLFSNLLTPSLDLWLQLWQTILPVMLRNTLILLAGVGCCALILGAGLAWLVTAYDFPGRAVFDHVLLLPLAMPSYILGFVFMALFDFAGPVQTAWRGWFGRGAWFPDIRSACGAILVLSLTLYPYVYLLARTAFNEGSLSAFEAARIAGNNRTQAFFRVVLPMARPALAGGTALVMMETLTDFATVRFLSYPTLSEGIVRIWTIRMDRAAASELASLLLIFALALIVGERLLRGRARYHHVGSLMRRPQREPLIPTHGIAAALCCVAVLVIAFIMPVGQLLIWGIEKALDYPPEAWALIIRRYILSSALLAGGASLLTVVLALITAQGLNVHGGRFSRALARLATIGYAMPGAVIAAGILLLLSPANTAINQMLAGLGAGWRLALTGSVIGLLYAYGVRFMSVAYNSVEASLEKITPNMVDAARTMGARPGRILWQVHLPLVSGGFASGVLLVFVDVMKELPATLLLRPFGMDTLAIWAYAAAAESFWEEAALPALIILLIGLVPVILLMKVGRNRDVQTYYSP